MSDNNTEPGTTEAAESEPVSIERASTDDLRDLINAAPADDTLVIEESDDEPETDESETGDEVDSDDDEQDEAEPTEPGEEPQPEDEADDTPDPDELRLQEMEARAKHFEALAGRNAGRMGHLESQNNQLMSQIEHMSKLVQRVASGETGEIPQAPVEPTYQQPPAVPQAVEPNAQYHSQQAVRTSLLGFLQQQGIELKMQDGVQRFSDTDFEAEISRRAQDLTALSNSGDARTAASHADLILSEAYAKSQMDKISRMRQEVEKKKADQAQRLKKAKKAQSAASTTRPSRQRKRKPKSLKEVSTKDLKRAIDGRVGL